MDLDELAQADAETEYGFYATCAFKKRMGMACDGTEHNYSLAQISPYSEADFLNCYFWNECDDGLAQTEAVALVEAEAPWMHAMIYGNSLAQVDAEINRR